MKQKDLAVIFGSIAIFTLLWVGFSLWHVYTTSTIKEPLTSQLLQIPGTFDTGTIDNLKKRIPLSSTNVTIQAATPSADQTRTSLLESPASASATPTPEITTTPIRSTSGGGL